jgi:integrase
MARGRSSDSPVKVLAAAEADERDPEDALLIFALALYLGLRLGEIDRMQWSDLTLDGGEPVACVCSVEGAMTKSGKTRFIPISDELQAILLRHRQKAGATGRSGDAGFTAMKRKSCSGASPRRPASPRSVSTI